MQKSLDWQRMNNKGTMEQKNKLIPELRFPEFVKDGEWIEEKLGVLSNVIIGGTPSTTVEEYWNGNIGWIGSGELKNDLIKSPTKYITELGLKKSSTYLLPKDTTVLAMTGATLGKIGYLTFECCGNQSVAGFVNLKNLNSKYLYYQLQNQTKQIFSFAGGGAQAGINKYNIENILLQIPQKIDVENKEQKKIADCLSSLDELITAHNDKLETLKNHKKGLLQNLFPQENQKVPNYRFPEFVNDEEWEERKLGEVASFINGRAYKQEELLDNGKYRVLRVGNFFTNNSWYYSNLELDNDKYCDNGDLLYAWSASFGPRIWNGEKVIYHYHIWKVIESLNINKTFLFVLLDNETERMKSQNANGFALLHITKGTIENWKCYIPKSKKEQQKIAECLTAVDNLITAQTEKIEQLKAHKKGLMQGLFPKIEE